MNHDTIEEAKELWVTYWAARDARRVIYANLWSLENLNVKTIGDTSADELEMVWNADDNCTKALIALEDFYSEAHGDYGLTVLTQYIDDKVDLRSVFHKDNLKESQTELDKLTDGICVTG